MAVFTVIIVASLCTAYALLHAPSAKRSIRLGAAGSDFASLERKLLNKLPHSDSAVTLSSGHAAAVVPKPISASAARIEGKVIANKVSLPPLDKSPTVLSPVEVFGGVALGLAPFIIIPAVAYSAFRSKLQKPKPFPSKAVDPPTPPKVPRYTKSLKEGMKEGIEELRSGKSTPEVNLIRKGIKINLAGLGATAVVGVALFLNQGLSGPQSVVFTNPPGGQQLATVGAPKQSTSATVANQPSAENAKKNKEISQVLADNTAAAVGADTAKQAPAPAAVSDVAPTLSVPAVVAESAPPRALRADTGVSVAAVDAAVVTPTTVASTQAAPSSTPQKTAPARPTPQTDPKPEPNTVQTSDKAIAPLPGQKKVIDPTPETVDPPVVKNKARRVVKPDLVDPKAFEKFKVSAL